MYVGLYIYVYVCICMCVHTFNFLESQFLMVGEGSNFAPKLAREPQNILQCGQQALQQRTVQLKMSVVPSLRNSALGHT